MRKETKLIISCEYFSLTKSVVLSVEGFRKLPYQPCIICWRDPNKGHERKDLYLCNLPQHFLCWKILERIDGRWGRKQEGLPWFPSYPDSLQTCPLDSWNPENQTCNQFLSFFFVTVMANSVVVSHAAGRLRVSLFNTTLMSLGLQAKPTCNRKNIESVGNGFIMGKIFSPRQEIDLGIHWPRDLWACLLLIYWTPLLHPSDSSSVSKKAAECRLHLCHCEPSRRHQGVTRTSYLLVGILDLKWF